MDYKLLFLCNFAKAEMVNSQSGLSFTLGPALLTSKIIQQRPMVFSLLSFSLLSPSSALLALLSSSLLAPSLLSFPVAGNSHNCWPKLPSIAGLAESGCKAPVGVCQQPANKAICSPPQRIYCIHGKLEVKSLNRVIAGNGALKLAD